MRNMKNRKLGKFRLHLDDIYNNPEIVGEFFGILRIIPVRAEVLIADDEIEYIAFSDRFSEVPIGNVIPEYHFIIGKDSTGHVNLVEIVNGLR